MTTNLQGIWRQVASVAGIAITAGALGLALAPRPVAASAASYDGWKCASLYAYGAGDRKCCNDGDGGRKYCSTMCDIVVT